MLYCSSIVGLAPEPSQYSGRHIRKENSSVFGVPSCAGSVIGRIQLGTEPGNSANRTVCLSVLDDADPPPAGPAPPFVHATRVSPAMTAAAHAARRRLLLPFFGTLAVLLMPRRVACRSVVANANSGMPRR